VRRECLPGGCAAAGRIIFAGPDRGRYVIVLVAIVFSFQMPPLNRNSCPCDSSRTFAKCCGRWHAGAPAPDAQSLMRSRYSAFVLCNEQYLLSTWHPGTRPDSIPFSRNQKWLGLRIVDARVTGDDSAEVEFIARSKVSNASAVRLHERSRFVREGGKWFYVDGDLLK
jgi:SEC-C motif domain protein